MDFNFDLISNTTLDLMWDLNGHKTKNEVIDLLQKEVFAKIETQDFNNTCKKLRVNINNHPESEIMVFEEALEIFLRNFFQLKS